MIQTIIIGALTAAGLLVLVEVGCRWWVRRRSRYHVWPPGMRLENRLASEVFPELEPVVRFDINRDGERGGEVPKSSDGLYRVLAVGGSAVECFALDQPKSWPALLERDLNAPENLAVLKARRTHVGNIGHSGVGSPELDLILERVLPQYGHLDLILIMVGASDVYHWLEEGAPPSRPASPVPESMLFMSHPRQRFDWKPARSASREIAHRLHRFWLHPLERKERAGAWFANARRMRAEATEIRDLMPDATVMVDHFEHHFQRLCRRAMHHADRVVVILQPWFEGDYTPQEAARFWHGGVGRPWKEPVTVYYSLEVVNRLLDLVHTRAAHVSDQLRLQRVDLRSVLTARGRHFYDHDHYTAEGAAVVASAVASALLSPPASESSPEIERLAASDRW